MNYPFGVGYVEHCIVSSKDVTSRSRYLMEGQKELSLLQGVSHWNVSFKLTLTHRNMQVRFCLKVSAYSWGHGILVSSTSFQKNNIGWPQQPPTERVSNISEKLDFQWSIQKKGTGIGHLGARDNPTIKLNKNFDEMRLLR